MKTNPHINHYSFPCLDDSDYDSIRVVLESGTLTRGSQVRNLESEIEKYCNVKHAVVCSSGTAALHLAYQAAGVGSSANILTTPLTFVATANAALYCGAEIFLSDIDEKTGYWDIEKLQESVRDISKNKIKTLVPVHYGGRSLFEAEVFSLAQKNNILVIEDACHSFGAQYSNGKTIGCCEFSDLSVFSLHAVKTITAGEGGVITTNNSDWYEKLISLRHHGLVMEENNSYADNIWHSGLQHLGYNYRLTDIQCALGLSQLKKIDQFVSKRKALVSEYLRQIELRKKLPIKPLARLNFKKSAHHLFPVLIEFELHNKSRVDLMNFLKENGIGSQVHYYPVHLQPFYQNKYGWKRGDFKNSENYYKKTLSLPLHPKLNIDDISFILDKIECFFS